VLGSPRNPEEQAPCPTAEVQGGLEALQFDALLAALVDPVLVFDARGITVRANASAVANLGFDPVGIDRLELVRRADFRSANGEPFSVEQLPGSRAASGGTARDLAATFRTATGDLRHILATASLVSVDGRHIGTVIAYHDITEREQLMVELRETVELTETLNRINAAIDSALDFDSIMHTVVKESAEALGAERAAVALREREGWIARYLYGAPPGVRWVPVPEPEYRYIDEVAANAEPVVIGDALHDARIPPEIAEREGFGAVISIRLEAHGDIVGVLRYTFQRKLTEFSAAHRDFLMKLAAIVSLGLENARLLEAERDVSEKLQAALLTIPKTIPGIECGTLYHSASQTARVGGDFYDLFELRARRCVVVVGDVSGKGLEAAAMTSLVKNTLRAYAEEGHPPATVISKTNGVVLASSEPETFVTLFFGTLDTHSGRLVFCSAGHPRPIIKRHDGGVKVLETRSPFVGAFKTGTFVEQEARLERGDVLLLYTDGVTEARCPEGMLGEERLVSFVDRLPPTTARELPKAVYEYVGECATHGLSDDLAMLAVSLAR
jgi:serine phosphatase RsbU (regulator of sigma subunit)